MKKIDGDKVMDVNFLSKDAIAYISNKAIYSLLNNSGFIYQVPKEKNGIDIIHISPIKKLIFIDGNEETGLQHIFHRHRYFTNSFSRTEKGFVKTSRFSNEDGNLLKISTIAELLFDQGNLRPSKNKFPELVDVYDKRIRSLNNQTFRLVVYKGTKIVHTLFPVEHNKPLRKYQKLEPVIEYQDFEVVRLVVPYIDVENVVRFGIGGLLKIPEEKETWHGLFYNQQSDGSSKKVASVFIKETSVTYAFGIETRIQQISFYDFSKWEDKIIDLLENDLQLRDLLG